MSARKPKHPAAPAPEKAASEKILDVAQKLAQTLGFNGFSYADIAESLGVTKASLHYHYASKSDLGLALIVRYQTAFMGSLENIGLKEKGALDRLRRYIGLYERVMQDDRMCLCGMFAAEYETLPPQMQNQLRDFFDANERWLAKVLEDGLRTGELAFSGQAKERARLFLVTLEGAMLVARPYRESSRFRSIARTLLDSLGGRQAAEDVRR